MHIVDDGGFEGSARALVRGIVCVAFAKLCRSGAKGKEGEEVVSDVVLGNKLARVEMKGRTMYVETGLVEEDVEIVVVLLQQLACCPRALLSNPCDIESRLLRGVEVDLRCRGHGFGPKTQAVDV